MNIAAEEKLSSELSVTYFIKKGRSDLNFAVKRQAANDK